MKRKIIMVLTLILMLFLASCNGFAEVRLEIKGIEGVTDADINLDANTVKFSVSSEISTFDVSNILVPSDVKVTAYQDTGHTASLGETLNLVEGENVFYLKLSTMLLQEEWTLYITRLSNTTKSPKSIAVKYLDEAYNLNEKLSSGVLLVTYNDDSQEEVPITSDMVSGFDTKIYGEKQLTISYKGLVTTFNYKVVRSIVEINVADEWKHDYLVGTEDIYPGGVLELVLDNGSIEEVAITKNMVSNFNTATSGYKELVITYKGKTTTFGYVVHSTYTDVKIVNLKTNYEYGEHLQGKIKFVLGDYVFTKPLMDFVKDYDAYTCGEQTITVPEFGLVAKVYVSERGQGDNFTKPTESKIEFDDIMEVYAIIYAISNSGRFQGEEFEKEYEAAFEQKIESDAKEEVTRMLRLCGVTKEQVDKVVSLYRRKAAPLFDSYAPKDGKAYNDSRELLSKITAEDIAELQEILSELLNIINPNQITMFLNETQGGYDNSWYDSILVISEDKEINYVEHDKYIELLEAAGLQNVAEFMETMESVDERIELSMSDINFMVELVYSALEAIIQVNAQDIHELLNYFIDASSDDFELDKRELLNIIHKSGDILKEVLIDTGILSDIENLYTNIAAETYIYGSGYNSYVLTKNVISLVSMYGEDIVLIAQNLTLGELDVIIDLISSADKDLEEKELAEYVVDIAKIIRPIIIDVNSNEQAKEMIADICSSFTSDKNVYSIISKAVSWTSFNSGNLTNAQIEEINSSIDSLIKGQDYICVSRNYYDVAVPVGSSIKDLLKKLSEQYTLKYIDANDNETPIQLTESSVKGLDTNIKGWHTVTVSQQGTTVKLYYYVFDPNVEGTITYIYNYDIDEYVLYFGLGTNTPDVGASYKESIDSSWSPSYYPVKDVMSCVYYNYIIANAGLRAREYLDLENVKYIVDTKTTGLKFGYIQYTTKLGDILIPFQCYVYDQEKPTLDIEDVVIYVEQYDGYYEEEYISIDFGRTVQQIAIILDSEMTQETGTIKKTIEGIEFTFIVLDHKGMNEIKKVTSFNMTVDASDPQNTYKLGKFTLNYIQKNGNSCYCFSYEELIDELSLIYDNPSVVIDWGTYTDVTYAQEEEVPYTIYDGSKVVYQGIARVNVLPTEKFDAYYYEIYNYNSNAIIVDSYDDVTAEKMLENKDIYKIYRYLNKEREQLTVSQFLQEVNTEVTFEEYEYYRSYTIRWNDSDYTRSTQIRVVLTENKDVILERDLRFNSMKFINIPTDEEVINEIHKKVYVEIYKVTGKYEYIEGQDAIDFLNSCNPYYNIEIDGNYMSITIECEVDGEKKTYYTSARLYIIDETSIIYPEYTEFTVGSLEKDYLFNRIISYNYYFYVETVSNGDSFYLYDDDFNMAYFEIVTDLSGKVSGDTFELECTYHGAKISFLVTYY